VTVLLEYFDLFDNVAGSPSKVGPRANAPVALPYPAVSGLTKGHLSANHPV